MLPRSCLRWAVSKSNSSTRLPRTTTTRVSSGWVASINILLGILELMTAADAYDHERVWRGRLTRRSTCFGGEGKAKTQPGAPGRTGSRRSKTTRGAFAPHRRDYSVDHGRQNCLAHQASARLNTLAAKGAALSVAESPARRQSARRPSHIGPGWVRIIGYAVSNAVPGARR